MEDVAHPVFFRLKQATGWNEHKECSRDLTPMHMPPSAAHALPTTAVYICSPQGAHGDTAKALLLRHLNRVSTRDRHILPRCMRSLAYMNTATSLSQPGTQKARRASGQGLGLGLLKKDLAPSVKSGGEVVS